MVLRERRKFLSFVAFILTVAQLLWGIPVSDLFALQTTSTVVQSHQSLHVERLSLEKGEISYYFNPKKQAEKTLFLVEDAHASLDAQESIQSIVKELKQKFPDAKIFVEGSEGPITWDIFWKFPDQKSRRMVSHYFLEKGRMSGAEVYSAAETDGEALYGLENEKAYQANVETYLDGLKIRPEAKKGLAQLQKGLNRLKGKFYTNQLRDWEKELGLFEKTSSSGLVRYLKFLGQWAGKEKLPLEKFLYLKEILELSQRSTPESIKQLESKRRSFAIQLFDEKDNLENNLLEKTKASQKTKAIVAAQKQLNLLRKLFELELTKREWDKLQKVSISEELRSIEKLLMPYSSKYKIDLSRIGDFLKGLQVSEQFYEKAEGREKYLFQNLEDGLSELNANQAIVVAGGFHSEGFRDYFRQKDFSIVQISPEIKSLKKQVPYWEVFEGKRTPLEAWYSGEDVFKGSQSRGAYLIATETAARTPSFLKSAAALLLSVTTNAEKVYQDYVSRLGSAAEMLLTATLPFNGKVYVLQPGSGEAWIKTRIYNGQLTQAFPERVKSSSLGAQNLQVVDDDYAVVFVEVDKGVRALYKAAAAIRGIQIDKIAQSGQEALDFILEDCKDKKVLVVTDFRAGRLSGGGLVEALRLQDRPNDLVILNSPVPEEVENSKIFDFVLPEKLMYFDLEELRGIVQKAKNASLGEENETDKEILPSEEKPDLAKIKTSSEASRDFIAGLSFVVLVTALSVVYQPFQHFIEYINGSEQSDLHEVLFSALVSFGFTAVWYIVRRVSFQKRQLKKDFERKLLQFYKQHGREALLREQLVKAETLALLGSATIVLSDKGEVRDTQWSPGMYRMLGLPEDSDIDPSFKSYLDYVHPDDKRKVLRDSKKIMIEQVPAETNYRIIRENGEVRYIHSKADFGESVDGQLELIMSFRDITEEYQMRERLRESEEIHRELFESSKDALMILEPSGGGQFIQGNSAAIKLFGIQDKKDFAFATPSNLSTDYQPDGSLSSEKAPRMIRIAMEKGSHFFEWVHRSKDGREFFTTVLLTKIVLPGGREVLQATIRDVTEERQAQEAVWRERNKLKQYLDVAGVGFVAIGADQIVTLANPKLAQILGYTQEEIVGKNWFDNFLPKRFRKEVKGVFDRLMAGELEIDGRFENPVLTKTGEERLIAWRNTVIRDENDNIVGSITSGEDITEQKKAQEEILRLATIVKGTRDVACSKDLDLKVIAANEAFLKMVQDIGYRPDLVDPATGKVPLSNVLGKTDLELFGDNEVVRQYMEDEAKVRDTGKMFKTVEQKIGADGSVRWASTLKYPVFDEGKIIGTANISSDITDRKNSEQTIEKLRAEIEEHKRRIELSKQAASISHDLKGPLAAMINNVEMADSILQSLDRLAEQSRNGAISLEEFRASKKEILNKFEIHQKAAEDAKKILDRLMGKNTAVSRLTSFVEIFQSLLDYARSECDKNGVNYEIIPPDEPIEKFLYLDPSFLNFSVFTIFIDNAVQSMADIPLSKTGKKLKIAVKEERAGDASEIVFEFQDAGKGLSQEALSKLGTERYTAGKEDGHGFGVLGAKKFLDTHGGSLEIESSGPGQGSTFRVRLPLFDAKEEEPAVKKSVLLKPAKTKPEDPPHILLVEDSEVFSISLKRQLEVLGFQVTTVLNGDEAMKKIHAGELFDIVVTDYSMPEKTGAQFAEEFFDFKNHPKIPVLMATGQGIRGVANSVPYPADMAKRKGAIDKVLIKPISAKELLQEAREVVLSQDLTQVLTADNIDSMFLYYAMLSEDWMQKAEKAGDENLSILFAAPTDTKQVEKFSTRLQGFLHDTNNFVSGASGYLEMMERKIEEGSNPEVFGQLNEARNIVENLIGISEVLSEWVNTSGNEKTAFFGLLLLQEFSEKLERKMEEETGLEGLFEDKYPRGVLNGVERIQDALNQLFSEMINEKEAAQRIVALGSADDVIGRRILFVEDELVVGESFSPMVSILEHDKATKSEVVWVTNEEDALEKLKEENFDVVILDLNFPKKRGEIDKGGSAIDVAAKAKEKGIHIIVSSGDNADSADFVRGAENMSTLLKPYNMKVLGAMLERIDGLERKQSKEIKRVLVVDDDDAIGTTLMSALEMFLFSKAETVWVKTVADAREKIQSSGAFDVVFLDQTLPDGQPEEVVSLVRTKEEGGGTKIVVTSGAPLQPEMEALADEFVAKPFRLGVIEELLKKFAEEKGQSLGEEVPAKSEKFSEAGKDMIAGLLLVAAISALSIIYQPFQNFTEYISGNEYGDLFEVLFVTPVSFGFTAIWYLWRRFTEPERQKKQIIGELEQIIEEERILSEAIRTFSEAKDSDAVIAALFDATEKAGYGYTSVWKRKGDALYLDEREEMLRLPEEAQVKVDKILDYVRKERPGAKTFVPLDSENIYARAVRSNEITYTKNLKDFLIDLHSGDVSYEQLPKAIRVITESILSILLIGEYAACPLGNYGVVSISGPGKKYKYSRREWMYSLIRAADGAIRKKETEEDLVKGEKRFKQLSEATWEAIVIHEDGVILEANNQYFDMFGYTPEELLGEEGISKTVTPDSAEWIRKQITKGNKGPYEVTGKRKDGTEFLIEIRVRMMDYHGRQVRVAAIRDITERKKKETELALLAAIVEHSADIACAKDLERRVTAANPAFLKAILRVGFRGDLVDKKTGKIPLEDVLGKTDLELFGESEIVERFVRDEKTALEERKLVSRLEKITAANGDVLWFLTEKYPVFNAQGEIIGIANTLKDITQLKDVENELRATQERTKLALDVTGAKPWAIDLAKNKTAWTPDFLKFLGYSLSDRRDFQNLKYEDVISPKDVDTFAAKLKMLVNGDGEDVLIDEHRLQRKDGSLVWVSVRAKVVEYDRDGSPLLVVGTAVDITEKKLAEAAIRGQKRVIETQTVELAKNRLLIDQNFDVVELAHQISSPLTGVSGNRALLFEEFGLLKAQIEQARAHTGAQTIIAELELVLENIFQHSEVNPTDVGKIQTILALLKKDLFKSAEIEPGNPLALRLENINLYLERLEEAVKDTEVAAKSPLDQARAAMQVEIVDPVRLMEDFLKKYVFLLKEKHITLDFQLPEENISEKILVNPTMVVTSVFAALLENAAEAILEHYDAAKKKGGKLPEKKITINISKSSDGKSVVYEFADTGVGISEENIRKLLSGEKGFTTKGEDGAKRAGTGAGFPRLKKTVEFYKGELVIESSEGNGTRMSVSIPLEVGITKKPDRKKKENLEMPPKVLIVDDLEVVLNVAKENFKKFGFKVITASNGKEALEIVKTTRVDAVVTDEIMPEMRGAEFVERFYDTDHPDIPLIIVSGSANLQDDPGTRRIFDQNLLTDFFKKPPSWTDVRDAIFRARPEIAEHFGVQIELDKKAEDDSTEESSEIEVLESKRFQSWEQEILTLAPFIKLFYPEWKQRFVASRSRKGRFQIPFGEFRSKYKPELMYEAYERLKEEHPLLRKDFESRGSDIIPALLSPISRAGDSGEMTNKIRVFGHDINNQRSVPMGYGDLIFGQELFNSSLISPEARNAVEKLKLLLSKEGPIHSNFETVQEFGRNLLGQSEELAREDRWWVYIALRLVEENLRLERAYFNQVLAGVRAEDLSSTEGYFTTIYSAYERMDQQLVDFFYRSGLTPYATLLLEEYFSIPKDVREPIEDFVSSFFEGSGWTTQLNDYSLQEKIFSPVRTEDGREYSSYFEMLAHDLNNSLTAISGLLDLIYSEGGFSENQEASYWALDRTLKALANFNRAVLGWAMEKKSGTLDEHEVLQGVMSVIILRKIFLMAEGMAGYLETPTNEGSVSLFIKAEEALKRTKDLFLKIFPDAEIKKKGGEKLSFPALEVEEVEPSVQPDQGIKSILIIEDEDDVIFILKRNFEKFLPGASIDVCNNEKAAIEIIVGSDEPFDLVVLDQSFPTGSESKITRGNEAENVAKAIRDHSKGEKTFILVASGYVKVKKELAAHIDASIMKPFEAEEIKQKLVEAEEKASSLGASEELERAVADFLESEKRKAGDEEYLFKYEDIHPIAKTFFLAEAKKIETYEVRPILKQILGLTSTEELKPEAAKMFFVDANFRETIQLAEPIDRPAEIPNSGRLKKKPSVTADTRPTSPVIIGSLAAHLAAKLKPFVDEYQKKNPSTPIYVMGKYTGGLTLGIATAQVFGFPFLSLTKRQFDFVAPGGTVQIPEEHMHPESPEYFSNMVIPENSAVIIVDDEATTGKVVKKTIETLKNKKNVDTVAVGVVLQSSAEAKKTFKQAAIPFVFLEELESADDVYKQANERREDGLDLPVTLQFKNSIPLLVDFSTYDVDSSENVGAKSVAYPVSEGEAAQFVDHPLRGMTLPLSTESFWQAGHGIVKRMDEILGDQSLSDLRRQHIAEGKTVFMLGATPSGILPATAASFVSGLPLVSTGNRPMPKNYEKADISNVVSYIGPDGFTYSIYGLTPGDSVFLVTGELNDGEEQLRIVKALKEKGVNVLGSISVLENIHYGGQFRLERQADIPVAEPLMEPVDIDENILIQNRAQYVMDALKYAILRLDEGVKQINPQAKVESVQMASNPLLGGWFLSNDELPDVYVFVSGIEPKELSLFNNILYSWLDFGDLDIGKAVQRKSVTLVPDSWEKSIQSAIKNSYVPFVEIFDGKKFKTQQDLKEADFLSRFDFTEKDIAQLRWLLSVGEYEPEQIENIFNVPNIGKYLSPVIQEQLSRSLEVQLSGETLQWMDFFDKHYVVIRKAVQKDVVELTISKKEETALSQALKELEENGMVQIQDDIVTLIWRGDEVQFRLKFAGSLGQEISHIKRVLIVDDEEITGLIFKAVLETILPGDAEIFWAGTAGFARSVIPNTGAFDVIFLDQTLPDGSSVEVAEVIRDKTPNTKIIATSDYGEISPELKKVTDTFVSKPARREAFLDVLKPFDLKKKGQSLGKEEVFLNEILKKVSSPKNIDKMKAHTSPVAMVFSWEALKDGSMAEELDFLFKLMPNLKIYVTTDMPFEGINEEISAFDPNNLLDSYREWGKLKQFNVLVETSLQEAVQKDAANYVGKGAEGQAATSVVVLEEDEIMVKSLGNVGRVIAFHDTQTKEKGRLIGLPSTVLQIMVGAKDLPAHIQKDAKGIYKVFAFSLEEFSEELMRELSSRIAIKRAA